MINSTIKVSTKFHELADSAFFSFLKQLYISKFNYDLIYELFHINLIDFFQANKCM